MLYTVGNKGKEYFQHREYTIAKDYSEVIENPMFSDAKEICEEVLGGYAAGEISEIYLAYTYFKNTVVHEPKLLKLLPVEIEEADIEAAKADSLMNYEPEETEALEIIIPKYVTSILYGALVEAIASENGRPYAGDGFRNEQCAGHDRSSDLAVQPCASGAPLHRS